MLILCVLALAAAAWFVFRPRGDAALDTVTVRVHDDVYCRMPLGEDDAVTIDQGDGRVNVIVIENGGVRMDSSTCKNQNCVRQGTVTAHNAQSLPLSGWIICLPNGVSVELTGSEDAP